MGARFGDDFERTSVFVGEFLDGRVVRKNLALTKTCCPTENGGDRDRRASADLW